MKILVTGHEGNIGRSLLERGCYPFVCNVNDNKRVGEIIFDENPDLIIHCAAITDVDLCEKKENAEIVIQTNFKATIDILSYAETKSIPVIVMSSDHVFDGKRGNYSEKDSVKPLNFYGLSKSTMEAACKAFSGAYIVRTSALFAQGMKDFGAYEQQLSSGTSIEIPTVLYRTFCHVDHFVEGLLCYASMIYRHETDIRLLHISGTENISWYELALSMADCGGYNPKLIKTRSRKDDSFVPRPLNAGLNTKLARQLEIPLFSFHDGLKMIYG